MHYPIIFGHPRSDSKCPDLLSSQELVVVNTGSAAFDFTCALHTYFGVQDIAGASVAGLEGTTYLDSLEGRAEKVESDDAVRFPAEVGRSLILK